MSMRVCLDAGVLLEESGLVFVLHVRPELDLCLDSSKLAGLVKGHRVGAVQNVIPGLREEDTSQRQTAHRKLPHSYATPQRYR